MIREKWTISDNYKNASISVLQENLAALRAKADVSQEEIGSIIGVSRQTYCSIESGKRTMSWGIYLSLVLFFHEIDSTKEMLDGMNVFPTDLFVRFNS